MFTELGSRQKVHSTHLCSDEAHLKDLVSANPAEPKMPYCAQSVVIIAERYARADGKIPRTRFLTGLAGN